MLRRSGATGGFGRVLGVLIFQLSVELLPHIDGLPRSQILTLARQIMQKMQ
eukprot:COSAG02_NODE_13578_length_1376_cov_8.440094_1_plen_50_part_10